MTDSTAHAPQAPATNVAAEARAASSWVWGLPLVPWTRAQVIDAADRMIAAGTPSFFITANLHYAMLCHQDPSLREVNDRADFLLADGVPLVWASRWQGTPLPERVAGSDLIYDLARLAADRGYRLFLLGGAPGIADLAADKLRERFPALRIAGTHCPPFRPLSPDEQRQQIDLIRASGADILLTAFTMPRGERWVTENLQELGVPLCVNCGASLDFVAGRVRRAPRWMQRTGLEWFFRMAQEPARLAPRYARNARFLLEMTLRGPRTRPGDPAEANRR